MTLWYNKVVMAQTLPINDVRSVKGRGYLLNKGTDTFSARIVTLNGRITSEQARKLADIADTYGNGKLTFTTRLSVEMPGIPFAKIDAFEAAIKAIGLSVGGTGPKVRPVVACKGTTCPCGLVDTFALAEAIHRKFYLGWHDIALPGKFKIAVGGCPNNCVKPNLNDLGIVGCILPNRKRGYRVLLGGHWGRTGGVGSEAATFATEEETIAYVEKVLTFYRDYGQPGERFFKTFERFGGKLGG